MRPLRLRFRWQLANRRTLSRAAHRRHCPCWVLPWHSGTSADGPSGRSVSPRTSDTVHAPLEPLAGSLASKTHPIESLLLASRSEQRGSVATRSSAGLESLTSRRPIYMLLVIGDIPRGCSRRSGASPHRGIRAGLCAAGAHGQRSAVVGVLELDHHNMTGVRLAVQLANLEVWDAASVDRLLEGHLYTRVELSKPECGRLGVLAAGLRTVFDVEGPTELLGSSQRLPCRASLTLPDPARQPATPPALPLPAECPRTAPGRGPGEAKKKRKKGEEEEPAASQAPRVRTKCRSRPRSPCSPSSPGSSPSWAP